MSNKAPGRSDREGIPLIQLFDMFPDDRAAEEWFEEARWGQAGKPSECPMCGGARVRPVPSRKPLPYYCGDCRSAFSVRTNSVMHRSPIPLRKWAIAVYLWSVSLKGVSSMRLHRDLGLTQKSAYFMAQRLRECWSGEGFRFEGPVEVDETFIGGKEKNKHASKKLRAGRGAVGKTAVVGARDRETGKVHARPVEGIDARTLKGFVYETSEEGATVYTDDAKAYQGMERKHEAVKHSVSEYVNGMAHTNGIESFWAGLKRGYHGTFHFMSAKHLHRYVNEFAARHNIRQLDTVDMMREMAVKMGGKRLTYRRLVDAP